ncbi:MAG: CAP domain-containing protein [Thermoleophilia bacterium]|nr:CAP domain-containing protein [Thermoleophilia bacterium]
MLTAVPAQAGGCAFADVPPASALGIQRAERATRCLVNRERRKHGMHALRLNTKLKKSSNWQAGDMAANAYFGHQRAGGPGFAVRVTRFGYASHASGYSLGENLAWATGGGASPRAIVRMWMNSTGHRANILRRRFKEQAVSAVAINGNQVGGAYAGAGPLVIYVNQFGTRY